MTAFYKEAARLWDLDAGRSSLTKIQAAMCLCKNLWYRTPFHS
jgi:hypothetical protein